MTAMHSRCHRCPDDPGLVHVCGEVLDRLIAADRIRDLDIDPELAERAARQLREQARRISEVHLAEVQARR